MRIKRLLLPILAMLVICCNEHIVYQQIDSDFDSNRWMKTDVLTYNFDIGTASINYDLDLVFSHVYDYQFAEIPLVATITSPDGRTEKIDIILKIKNDSGKDAGDCSGDFCDLTQNLKKGELPVGKYTVKLEHAFQGEYLPNVLGLGIRLSKQND